MSAAYLYLVKLQDCAVFLETFRAYIKLPRLPIYLYIAIGMHRNISFQQMAETKKTHAIT